LTLVDFVIDSAWAGGWAPLKYSSLLLEHIIYALKILLESFLLDEAFFLYQAALLTPD